MPYLHANRSERLQKWRDIVVSALPSSTVDATTAQPDAYHLPPIVAIMAFRCDSVVIRARRGPSRARRTQKERGKVTMFSRQSRKRLAFVVNNSPVTFKTLVTLTYPLDFPSDGTTVKKHLRAQLQAFRRRYDSIDYVWFIEWQKRGAPHFHVLLSFVMPVDKIGKRAEQLWLSSSWYSIVDSKDEKHFRAGTRMEKVRKVDGAARYACKYAAKMRQKAVPPGYTDVGRFWGASRGCTPKAQRIYWLDKEQLAGILADWEFWPSPDRPVYQVLYNTGPLVRARAPKVSGVVSMLV